MKTDEHGWKIPPPPSDREALIRRVREAGGIIDALTKEIAALRNDAEAIWADRDALKALLRAAREAYEIMARNRDHYWSLVFSDDDMDERFDPARNLLARIDERIGKES